MKVKIGDLTKIKTGKLDANVSSEDGKYPFFTCSKEPLKISTYSYDCECVLVAGNGDLNVKYYNGKFDAYQRTYIIEANGSGKLYMPYLYYFMEDYIDELRKQAIGGVIKYIKLANLTDALIELPSVDEQKSIVEILKKVKGILDKRNDEIRELDNLIKARFVEMFGDPIQNPKGWEVVTIGDIVTEVRYGTSKPAVEGGKYPYLRMNNLTADGHLDLNDLKYIDIPDDEIEKCVVRKGDVLFNRTNSIELVGKTAVFDLPEDMIIAGYIIRVRLTEKMLPEVLSQYMNLEALKGILRGMAKGAVNQANINAQELQSIKVYIPEMELQKQFVKMKEQIYKSLFDGLYISQNKALCDEHMGKYPVIFLTLKGVEGLTFADAKMMLKSILSTEMDRHYYLKTSEALTDEDKAYFVKMLTGTDENINDSLRKLSQLLYKHYGKKAVILIDEYDVPLDKAYQNGYYHEMVSLIRGLFGQALKTNDYLQFAILTGCLRISKESIFTGLNNFKVLSIMDTRFDEQFGFTDSEVEELLAAYNLDSHFTEIKEWYDGYHFGNADVYCPWDVINYVDLLRFDPTAKPQDFWSNSSGNALVRSFIDKADVQTKDEIERLIAGEYIEKEISQELTYDEIDKSIANLWSVLFTTGYLTKQGVTDDGKVRLSIPNREIKNLFIKKIREWFSDTTANDGKTLEQFCNAFVEKDTEKIERLFGDYLWNTISIRDTAVAKDKKENFYHGILLGLLGYKASWLIKSNTESGTGYSDILVEVPNNRTGIVIELKYAENGDMDAACDEALKQIEEKSYVDKLKQDGMRNFIKYGIAYFKKDCKVVVSE